MRKFYFLLCCTAVLVCTQAGAQSLAESFETAVPPAGWTSINGGSSPNNWARVSSSTLVGNGIQPAQDGSYIAGVLYNTANAANAWLITPAQSLTAGTSYTISFYYSVADPAYPEKMKVTVGNAATIAAQTNVLWNNNGATSLINDNWLQGIINYTPTTSGAFYFGFNCYSDADKYIMMLDNVRIQVTPSSAPTCVTNIRPANNATNVNPHPAITLKWNTNPVATGYDVYFGTNNAPTILTTVAADSVNIVNTNYSTTYFWYVVPKNVTGSATGCSANITSFTTGSMPPPPANDSCAGALAFSTNTLSGSTLGATQTLPANACDGTTGTANDDVWYKFTALSSGPVVISVTGNGSFDAVIEGFSGSCAALTSIACSDSSFEGGREQFTINATVGSTYYIRVFNWFATLSGRGTFTISGSGAPLPIALTSFRAERQGSRNVLLWSTGSEQNNAGYELQRSVDGKNFSTLSFIPSKAANGNSNAPLQYTFSDVKPLRSINYYRLKQLDKDGKSTLSQVVLLKGERTSIVQLSAVYPNPTRNKLNVVLSSPGADQLQIVVTDLAGKTMMSRTMRVISGDNNLVVDVAALRAGTYIVKAICATGCEMAISKFVKN